MTPQQMLDNIRRKTFDQILDEVLTDLMPKIIELNKDQLFSGQTRFGSDIHPLYSEDPYFKSPAAAKAYANWKQKPEFNPHGSAGRNPDAPNLYIYGVWHSNIKGFLQTEFIEIDATGGFGAGLDDKWRDIYGLTPDHLEIIRKDILPILQQRLRNAIGI